MHSTSTPPSAPALLSSYSKSELPSHPKPTPSDSEYTPRYVRFTIDREPAYLDAIRALVGKDLSEPYSIPVYRYFLYEWGEHCFLAFDGPSSKLIGVVVCKLSPHRNEVYRGYIAMLVVEEEYRGRGIASNLVRMSIQSMKESGADEIMLETEIDNEASLAVYERLGFTRTKRLHRYYLNGNDAFRLILSLDDHPIAVRT